MKNLLILLLFIFTLNVVAQTEDLNDDERNRNIAFTLTQDGRLTFWKDDSGNVPFTLDITGKVELRMKSDRTGYLSLILYTEYADLAGGDYLSYGILGGGTFDTWLHVPTFGGLNKDFIDLDITPYAGIVEIQRKFVHTSTQGWDTYNLSVVVGVEFTLKVHEKVGLVTDFKFVDRQDLKAEYTDFNEFMSFNVGVGIKYELGR